MKLIFVVLCVVFLLCVAVTFIAFVGADDKGDSCVEDDSKCGLGIPVGQCMTVLQKLKKNILLLCGFSNTTALICCDDFFELSNSILTNATENDNDISEKTVKSHESCPQNTNNITTEQCFQILENIKKKIPSCQSEFLNKTCIFSNSSHSFINITNKNYYRIPGTLSKAKCYEYAKYSYEDIVSPVLSTKFQHEKIYDCHKNLEALTLANISTSRKEFPHVGYIGYRINTNNVLSILYICKGGLISEKFVLTTAYCLRLPHIDGIPVVVRFPVTLQDDSVSAQQIKIQDYFVHPNYEDKYHDIGLVKLKAPVKMNLFFRPACLNTVRNIHYRTAVVNGWGIGGDKDFQKSIVNIVPGESCGKLLNEQLTDGVIEDFMICAGIENDQRKDVCQNQIGSPLQVRIQNSTELQCMSSIIGVTSFGQACNGGPGIYTRVSAYIDWIESVVWPDSIPDGPLTNSNL